MENYISQYPAEIIEIATSFLKKGEPDLVAIVPIYARGFIAVIDSAYDGKSFKPYTQRGIFGKDFITLDKVHMSYASYDEAMIALITYRNLGESQTAKIYIDTFCNKMGVTSHSNSINPEFKTKH